MLLPIEAEGGSGLGRFALRSPVEKAGEKGQSAAEQGEGRQGGDVPLGLLEPMADRTASNRRGSQREAAEQGRGSSHISGKRGKTGLHPDGQNRAEAEAKNGTGHQQRRGGIPAHSVFHPEQNAARESQKPTGDKGRKIPPSFQDGQAQEPAGQQRSNRQQAGGTENGRR